MITVESLSKYYHDLCVLDNVSFRIEAEEVVGLLGPNGAGKTTTMRILAGALSYNSGSVNVHGSDIFAHPVRVKQLIGYLPENPPLYREMPVRKYLTFVARLYGLSKKQISENIEDVISRVNLQEVENRIIGRLSKGYQQRVGIAQVLIHNPRILILDEPTNGLDPRQIIEIRSLIKDLTKRHTIIISSHILSEISQICDRVLIINKGRIATADSIRDLTGKKSSEITLQLKIKAESRFIDLIRQTFNCTFIKEEGQGFIFTEIISRSSGIYEDVFTFCTRHHLVIYELKTCGTTLEDVFLKMVEEGAGQENQKGGLKDEDTLSDRA